MTEPVYALGIELSVDSLTDITSYCETAHFESRLGTLFRPLAQDLALFNLNNNVGSLSPLLQPALLPGRRISFSAIHSTENFPLFSGRIRKITTRPSIGERTTVIEAVTEADRLQKTLIDTSVFVDIPINSLFSEVMTLCDVASYASQDIQETADFAWYQDRNALNAVNEIMAAGYYEISVDGSGTFRLNERYATGGFANVGYTPPNYSNYFDLNFSLTAEEVVNSFRLRAVPREHITSSRTLSYIGAPISIPASDGISFFMEFRDPRNFSVPVPVSPMSGVEGDGLVTPVASGDYYAAANRDGTGTNRTSTLSVSFVGFAQTAVYSIFSGVGTTVWLTRFQQRGLPILPGASIQIKKDDSSSQAVYGRREKILENLLVTNRLFLKAYAESLVSEQKNPQPLFSLTLRNEFPDVVKNSLGDVFIVTNSLTGVGSYWAARAVSHDIALIGGLEHTVTYDLERYRGPTPRMCEGVYLDGNTVYLSRHGNLTGLSNTQKFIFSAWYRPNSLNSLVHATLLAGTQSSGSGINRFYGEYAVSSAQNLTSDFLGSNGTGEVLTLGRTHQPSSLSNGYRHILVSVDMGTRNKIDFYVNDKNVTDLQTFDSNEVIDMTLSNWTMGGNTNGSSGSRLHGDLAEVYFAPGQYLDMAVTANRRKFIGPSGRPVEMGANGSLPTGNQPAIYMTVGAGGVVSDFLVNRGSGGNFALIGTLSLSIVAPSD